MTSLSAAGAIRLLFLLLIGAHLLLVNPAVAHGADPAAELAAHAEYAANNVMHLGHCAEKLKRDGLLDRAVARRSLIVDAHRKKRNLLPRDDDDDDDKDDKDDKVDQVLGTDHEDNSVNIESTQEEILATRDDGCVLMPEVTEGPFYVEGQYIRQNLQDDEVGVPVYLDLQIIDVESCEPVEDLYVEVWHTNATGIYSGVATDSDPANAHATFGRGISKTSADGAVWFGTIFPGHYHHRTPHVHIATHHTDPDPDADSDTDTGLDFPDGAEPSEPLPNNTLHNNVVSHSGQVYFDQKLVDAVRELEGYAGNDQDFVPNEDDAIFRRAAEVSDPVLSYFFLERRDEDEEGGGENGIVERGLLAWKLVGVNLTNVRVLDVAGVLGPQDADADGNGDGQDGKDGGGKDDDDEDDDDDDDGESDEDDPDFKTSVEVLE